MLATVLACVLVPLSAPPQGAAADAATPIARFQLLGKPAELTRGDVALEMAFHLRRQDDGRAACTQLIKALLVRRAANQKGAWPVEADVRHRWEELRQQMLAAGRVLEREPIFRNCSEATFLDYLAVDMALERLVRQELGLRASEQVSPAMLELWTTEAREHAKVVDDPDQLPLGTAVRVDDVAVPLLELGMLLLRSSDADEQDKFIRRVVVLQILEAMAKEQGVDVTEEELQRELSLRKAQADTDPRFAGLTFEQLLKTQGLTVDGLLQSRVFRAQVLQKKLVGKLHPRAELLARLDKDRGAVHDQFGPRRHLAVVFARALAEPNQLVPRDFAAAADHLRIVRQRLDREPFDKVAKIESEDPGTKVRGGDCGWLVRKGTELPEPVLAAAWALDVDAVSEPLRAENGCYLVKVLAIEPDLSDDVLIDRMRENLVDEFTAELVKQAAIERTDAATTAATATPTDRNR